MIVRGNKSQTKLKNYQPTIDVLVRQNKQLKCQILRLEQKLIQAQQSKKKYKNKYRQAKQKIQIFALLGNKQTENDPYELDSPSPHMKTTRAKSKSKSQFYFQGKLPQPAYRQGKQFSSDHSQKLYYFGSKKHLTPATTTQEFQRQDSKILQNLLKLHEQLEHLSQQIQKKKDAEPRVTMFEQRLYQKMDQVVDKMNKMQVRDLQRENRRIEHERQKSVRKNASSMKTIQSIGVGLANFRVDH